MTIEAPGAGQLPALKALWQCCFEDPMAVIDRFFETGFSPARCRCVTEQGRVIAALYWLDCTQGADRLAYIYAVATHPDCRGRGLCRALMADTHQLLLTQGYAGAVLVPGGPGLAAMYEKMGYRPFGGNRDFTCTAAQTPAALAQICREEYAKEREKRLPPGGVIQEGETLAWLACFAEFYAGADFLLAAAREGDRLFAQELLGNAERAPEILKALGCTWGRFRTPGGETPFAMYCPLNRAEPPAYFGLALD